MKRLTLLRLFFTGMLGLWGIAVIFIGMTALPYHSASPSADLILKAQTLFPEGWHFFTKDARLMQTRIYYKDGHGNWRAEDRMPNSSSFNYFGASREGRSMGVEYALFLKELRSEDWVPFRGDESQLLANTDTIPLKQIYSEYDQPIMCGEYLFVAVEPVPWAWSSTYDRVKMPASVTRLQINCTP